MKDESQLIDAARQGDTQAFGDLVHQYQDRLFNAMSHLLGNPELAEEVVQETFVRAYFRLDSFKGSSRFYTWVYRIAFNLSITERRRKRPEHSVDTQDEGIEPHDRGETPGSRMEREESLRQLEMALAKLTDDFRAVIVLREIEGCSYENIAQILDISVGTVRSRIHRGREQLREILQRIRG